MSKNHPTPAGSTNGAMQATDLRKLVTTAVDVIPDADAGDDAQARIVGQLLTAETVEQLLTPAGGTGLDELVGRPIVIHDARKTPSDKPDGCGWWLLLDVEDSSTGKRMIVDSGATNVVAIVAKAYSAGWLPLACKLVVTASNRDPSRHIHQLVTADAF